MYSCVGFCAVEAPPSPNSQDQEVGAFVERSVKVTSKGATPAVGLAVKSAAGALMPRYPDGVRLINVYRDEGQIAEALVSWDVADLVGEEAKRVPLIESRGRDFPPQRELGTRLTGEIDEVAQAAAEALRQRNSQVH